jgi:F0F1-type ATP synthase membrane subunit b/b'
LRSIEPEVEEARTQSQSLLANVDQKAKEKVADAIKQLSEGATSLE